MGTVVLSRWQGERGVKLTIYLHLVSRLGMKEDMSPLPLCAFMARIGKTLLLFDKKYTVMVTL